VQQLHRGCASRKILSNFKCDEVAEKLKAASLLRSPEHEEQA